jgi:ketosteroid isomerase-like protein
MSQENMEVVRRTLESYSAGDNEAAFEGFDPKIKFDVTFRPDGQVYEGREGVAEGMRIWTGTFAEWRFEVNELIDAGDHVLAVVHESGRGKGSAAEIEQTIFQVFTLRDAKVVRFQAFLDRGKALEAAGLPE